MNNKTLYICTICTKSEPSSLIPMNEERTNIIVAVTSEIRVKKIFLLMCSECSQLLDAVMRFKKIAVTGVRNLLQLTEKLNNSSNITNCVYENSTATCKQENTETVYIKSEPECHIVPNTDSRVTPAELTEELIIKDEPEFETESRLDFESEPEESKLVVHEDHCYCYAEPNHNNINNINNTESLHNIEHVNTSGASNINTESLNKIEAVTSVGASYINIELKTEIEADIKIKTERDDESTDTCESDYGNEEDIMLAALVKRNTPTLAYLKEKPPKTIPYLAYLKEKEFVEPTSQSKTSKAKSKRRRKAAAKKWSSKKKTRSGVHNK